MKYAALLRGINVGGNNKVSMAELKKSFEQLGFTNVSTYINSGNVIFEASKSKDISEKIEKQLHKDFKFPIKVLVRDYKSIKKLIDEIPHKWNNDKEQRTDVLFLWNEFDKKSSLDLLKVNLEVDHLMYISGAIVWNLDRINYTKSAMHKFIGTVLYKNMTARNINTVRKLEELMSKA